MLYHRTSYHDRDAGSRSYHERSVRSQSGGFESRGRILFSYALISRYIKRRATVSCVMLVVLGLDSWDHARYQQFDTPTVDSLIDTRLLEPFDGLAPGELITQVLWPAMLYGENPKTIWPEFYDRQSGYDDAGSDEEPDPLRERSTKEQIREIGRRTVLRAIKPTASNVAGRLGIIETNGEFDRDSAGKELIERRESLVSAADNPRLVSVPGINEDVGNHELRRMVDREGAKNVSEYSLNVTAETYEQRVFELDAAHEVQTLQAVHQGYDLVWAHFAGLDSIQHRFSDSTMMMGRWYRFYDNIVSQVISELGAEDTLVVVSDHGMDESGLHSRRAFFGATKQLWPGTRARMEDLRGVLETELKNHTPTTSTEAIDMSVGNETKEHLKELGYID